MRGKALYWRTVSPLLRDVLLRLMKAPVFNAFRLVGGTSLSLQLGHRMSVDIDLFTDAPYGTVDFGAIDHFLRSSFPYVTTSSPDSLKPGMGTGYFIGHSESDAVKLDLFYTEPFIRPVDEVEGVRLATMEDIAAMKINVVQQAGRKKDFWDIHEMMDHMDVPAMIAMHQEMFPHGHDPMLIWRNLTDFRLADGDFDPVCLRGKYWELIKYELFSAMG